MKLHQAVAGGNTFSGYGADYVAVNGVRREKSSIVLVDRILDWNVESFDKLRAEDFQVFESLQVEDDLLQFGVHGFTGGGRKRHVPETGQGRDVLRAVVAGYELMIRTSLAAGTLSMRRRGWHITGLCGTFGAAAAAGPLLGLDRLQMANALGLAGTQSAGLFAFTCDGANSKRLHPGRSAQSGVFAAELAARGFTGPTAVLEYEDGGFCHAVSDASTLELFTHGLGEDYVTAGVSLKPYACCGSTHSSIDAVRWLAHTYHIQPQDVEEIIVANHSVVKLQTSWWYEPVSPMQAQMNMEYCVAVALTDGNAGPQQFTSDKIADPCLVELAHKVRFEIDPEIEQIYPRAFPGRVAIRLRDGRIVEQYVPGPKGSPENPMTLDEVTTKFHLLVDPVLGRDRAERLATLIAEMDTLENVQSLTEMLR